MILKITKIGLIPMLAAGITACGGDADLEDPSTPTTPIVDSACEQAVARGAEKYVSFSCSGCHGPDGEGSSIAPDPLNFNLQTAQGLPLHQYIDEEMPLTGPGTCVGLCADDIAAYMTSRGDNPWCPAPSNGGPTDPEPGDGPAAPRTQATAKPPVIRRLSNLEFDNTLRDLLNVSMRVSEAFAFPDDATHEGFANQGGFQSLSLDWAEPVFESVTAALEAALTNNTVQAFACNGQSANACINSIITNFGKKAWRRPLSNEEVQSLVGIFNTSTANGFDFNESALHTLRSLLMSPNFLFMPEPDPNLNANNPRDLTAYELATRLSYFIWASTPDDELMALADSGDILNEQTLRAQTARLLNDPRSDILVSDFARRWLGWDLNGQTPNLEVSPQYSKALAESMKMETYLFISELFGQNKPAKELLTADYSYLDGRLKHFYGYLGANEAANTYVQPIVIQAEDYADYSDSTAMNLGGEYRQDGVDIEASTDVGGGYNIGYVVAGEWLEYVFNVPVAGEYEVVARVASEVNTGSLNVSIDGNLAVSGIIVMNAAGWQAWESSPANSIGYLSAGQHTLRVQMTGPDINLNWLQISPIGRSSTPDSFERIVWNGQPRQGILTNAAVLLANSNVRDDHPVRRGNWVMEKLTCSPPPAPSADVLTAIDAIQIPNLETMSTRDQLVAKTSADAACSACHQYINPYGFGLGNYGPIGQYREEETRGSAEPGPWPIDASSSLPSGESFVGALEMSDTLASSYSVPLCIINHMMTYALGRHVVGFESLGSQGEEYAHIYDVYKQTEAQEHRMHDIVTAIVLSDAFRKRTGTDFAHGGDQ